MKRVLILGAGISGLSIAWYLAQFHPGVEITILEKNACAGGWIQTDHTTGFHFEKGPRAFMAKKSSATLELVRALKLDAEIIATEAKLHNRYLWFNERLHSLPRSAWGFLTSPLTRGLIPALLTEWIRSPCLEDETVWAFAARRFSRQVADRLFDPLVVGIFGGDARQISIRACFPMLKQWEEKNGSITRGMLQALVARRGQSRFSEKVPTLPLSAFYSFKQGMGALIDALVSQVPAQIVYNETVERLTYRNSLWTVETAQGTWTADTLISALPAPATARLFQPLVPDLTQRLSDITSLGFTLVNVGYRGNVLPLEGFGYLTQSKAQEAVLGAVFDSSVFPEHNRHAQETRITVKLADKEMSEQGAIQLALQGIGKHLKLDVPPDVVAVTRASCAIPQYGIAHLENMAAVQEELARRLPHCRWVGNYLSGVAVDQCIALAKSISINYRTQIVV